jgi:hypothetical protein
MTEPEGKAPAHEVRTWAKANGYAIGEKGRISRHIRKAFTAATGRAA